MIDALSEESDVEKRKHRVRAIHENFAEDDARPIIFSNRAATSWQSQVKGRTLMVNSAYNGDASKTSG